MLRLGARKHLVGSRNYGPERVVNQEFLDGGTGWTVLNSDGTHIVTFSAGAARYQSDTLSPELLLAQSGIVQAGRNYEIRIVIRSWTSGWCKVDHGAGNVFNITGPGIWTSRIRASNSSVAISRGSTNVDMVIESMSVREVF